ncbi:Nif11-like leader peptide family natural product precursor [Synechococcus elongatus]|uniref:Nif11-like leader peptide family natural product n=2 Tax=Synechococcus elongatus TaxID=32046 RepID=A0AAN1QMN3_SYNEL|nr:Nif11-like leader peptide family natural product precursor [Synechococcus elongatus]AZB72197.1 Nif11-like leader peptide family natural product precursor [Synechococcus elongatus PCC 11801]QFZ91896.1 Nif11 family protein [Synechococcus elongatus PCC 11802]
MSSDQVLRFLEDAAISKELRDKFSAVSDASEFLLVAQRSGYAFTSEEFIHTIAELSKDVPIRRQTGVWRWLRTIHNPMELERQRRSQSSTPTEDWL